MTPLEILVILVILAALLVPLIPVRRRRRRGLEGFPVVTACLLAVNVFLFAANTQMMPDGGVVINQSVAEHWGLIPRQATLVTLFTYMFLHGSWGHVFGNMLGLWLFGPHVEEALGKLEYLLFYIGAGIAGGLLHLVIADTMYQHVALSAAQVNVAGAPLVGASGAIFGVLGLYAVRFWRTKMRVFLLFHVPSIWAVGAFALIQFFAGILSLADGGQSSNTANWAHVGGFLFGLGIALPLRMREDSRVEYSLEDAQIAQAAGRLDQAAAHYRHVIAATPDDADAHRALAQVCTQMRQAEAAHRHYQEALRLYIQKENANAVAATYGDALTRFEVFPLPPTLLQRVASACEEVQAYPLALSALSELCREYPATPEGEMGLLRLGRLHLAKLNQPQNAAGIFSEFLRTYPDSSWRHHAERLFTEAIEAGSAHPRPSNTGAYAPDSGWSAGTAAPPTPAPQES